MFQWIKKKKKIDEHRIKPLCIDVHSHLLPGLDDGASNLTESLGMLKAFEEMGYQKMIMTPHIMSDAFKNSEENILPALHVLQEAAVEKGISISLEAAAEYYLDEEFMELLKSDQELLTFGEKKYLLFEMSYINPTHSLEQAAFYIQTKGYTPVLAHPERYLYLEHKYDTLKELHQQGVLLQLNALSLSGYYSSTSKRIAEKMIDDEIVSFVGSDCHKLKHAQRLQELHENYYYKKVLTQPLLNHSL